MTQLEHDNIIKYGNLPPSYEKIVKYAKKLRFSLALFERVYGIPRNVIYLIKIGERKLPAKYWHFIYEQLPPDGRRMVKKRDFKRNSSTNFSNPPISTPAPDRPEKGPETAPESNPDPPQLGDSITDRIKRLKGS